MSAQRKLLAATLGLAFVVVVVGAYVRLSDAGLAVVLAVVFSFRRDAQ